MNTNQPTSEKLTETIRGRVEPALKERMVQYEQSVDRSESYVLRQAIAEFLQQREKKRGKKD